MPLFFPWDFFFFWQFSFCVCVFFFNLFLFFIYLFFPKSAQAGLRLPGCTHIYGNKGFSYSIYNLYQEEQGAWEKEEGDTAPHSPAKKLKRRGNNPPPGSMAYVPSIMEECAPKQPVLHRLMFRWLSLETYFEKLKIQEILK